MTLGTWFVNPMQLGSDSLWLVAPLCVAVALAYKTIRVRHLGDLPKQVLGLCAYILVGLFVLGLGLYLLQQAW